MGARAMVSAGQSYSAARAAAPPIPALCIPTDAACRDIGGSVSPSVEAGLVSGSPVHVPAFFQLVAAARAGCALKGWQGLAPTVFGVATLDLGGLRGTPGFFRWTSAHVGLSDVIIIRTFFDCVSPPTERAPCRRGLARNMIHSA